MMVGGEERRRIMIKIAELIGWNGFSYSLMCGYYVVFVSDGKRKEVWGSDGLFDVPDECADSDFEVAFVEFVDCGEEFGDFVVVDNGHNGRVHFGPCVSSATGFAAVGSTALDVFEEGEARYAEIVEHIFHPFGIGLVEYYEYCFHC